MNPFILVQVAAYANCRRTRSLLGFPVERCIQLRVPPCAVHVEPGFASHMSVLCAARLTNKPLIVYNPQSQIAVSIKFWWRFCRLSFKVRSAMTLSHDPYTVRSTGATCQRTYDTYPLTGEHHTVALDPQSQWSGYGVLVV